MLFSCYQHAQAPVTGIVSNKNGKPLTGISVAVKGKSAGTAAGTDDSYTINAAVNDILVFSSIGFATREVNVTASGAMNVSMETRVNDLEDLVVVAYGTQKRKDITGSVAVVNVAEKKNTVPAMWRNYYRDGQVVCKSIVTGNQGLYPV